MGCVVSKEQNSSEDDVVSLCRDRKKLLKLALEERYAFAEAHCKYNESLHAMAEAIKIFIARFTCPSTPLLISFPEPTVHVVTNKMCATVQHTPKGNHTQDVFSCKDSVFEDQDEKDDVFQEESDGCGHMYGDSFGWDYFDSFEGENVKSGGKERIVEDEKESKSLEVIDGERNERELLEALKDVEDYFVKAYESGLDVSRMLEVNRARLQSNLVDIKDSSTKAIKSITWNRSLSSGSSSNKSLITSASMSSMAWTGESHDLFDGYEGMQSGQHSLTLDRLYAWEKKLYQEVKAGDGTRKNYEKKILQLRNQNVRGDSVHSTDKTTSELRSLHARMLINVRGVESISNRIQMLRDEELQPELVEMLHGLMRNWKIMLESHQNQSRIMSEIKSFHCSTYGKFCNDSHRLATLQLEAEIQNWRDCFLAYVSTQKAYIEALGSWLSRFVIPEVEMCYAGQRRYPLPPSSKNGPPALVLCQSWLHCLDRLPDDIVANSMKSFAKNIRALCIKQGAEQKQKRKVDALSKELDKRVLAFQRSESKILEEKACSQESELDVHRHIEYLTGRKIALDKFRNRLDVEKAEHQKNMQETQQATVYWFRRGFPLVFDTLVEFSNACVEVYADLVTYSVNEKLASDRDKDRRAWKD